MQQEDLADTLALEFYQAKAELFIFQSVQNSSEKQLL
jgi:hypothetical protein